MVDAYRKPKDGKHWGIVEEKSEVTNNEGTFGPRLWNAEGIDGGKICRTTPRNGATNLVECLEKAKDKHAVRKAVGWRELKAVHMEKDDKGIEREKLELANEYQWLTYHQYHERVLNLARGLAFMGLEKKGKVVIYAETQRDWMVSAFASWYSNAQVVTIYATLGAEGAVHGINETEASVVIADQKLLKIVAKILPECPSIKHVVTMTKSDDASLVGQVKNKATLQSIEELIDAGKSYTFSPERSKPEDTAVIMYTSGTTGAPKGVVLSHGNIVSMVAGLEHGSEGAVSSEADDVYLAYLPLAHIMEMVGEIVMLSMGLSLGYGSPHTLTDTGVKLKKGCIGDAPCLQPTFMVFAPAVLDKVFQAIQGKRSKMAGLKAKLFDWGVANGEKHFGRGQVGANWFFDKVVFSKTKAAVGGKLKFMFTGSAPLSPDIQVFIQTVLGAPVRQGYGLTETCAGSFFGYWGDNSTKTVGPPSVCTVARLADWPEGNYLTSDKDKKEIGMMRGEVLIAGPSVSKGYYVNEKNPNPELQKKNVEDWIVIGDEKYFRTGDIGQITEEGCLQIIDRKKDLWKGPNGEYVALTKVEAALKLNEYVEMPMVYGKTGGEYPIALICPMKGPIMALGKELGLPGDFAVLCKEEKVVDKVFAALKDVCKQQKLLDFETPKKIALISDLWTPENDMLTAAMKLKRVIIAQKHKEDVDKCYGIKPSASAPKAAPAPAPAPAVSSEANEAQALMAAAAPAPTAPAIVK
jgi:long-subunit acyl-CoA synthetase (AMP-forming)